MKNYRTFKIKNSLHEMVNLLREWESMANDFQFSEQIIFDVTLALEELLTNIISYGFLDASEHIIEVEICIKETKIEIDIIDGGTPFNPLEKAPPAINGNLQERTIGGLGIYLVKQKIDHIEYRRSCEKNIVKLIKNC